MAMQTTHFERCIETLDISFQRLLKQKPETTDYEILRNAVIKGFELTLETSGKLLRKALKAYDGNPKAVDDLFYKDVLRHAGKHGLLDSAAIERWFLYRDNRNDTAHDYGEAFAEGTLKLLPAFIADAKILATILRDRFKDIGDA